MAYHVLPKYLSRLINAQEGLIFLFLACLLLFSHDAFATKTADPFSPNQNQYVKVQGQKLLTNFDGSGYKSFQIRGVGYSPMPIGRHPSDWGYNDDSSFYADGAPRPANILDDELILRRDFALLKAMNANTIRIWKGDDTQSDGRYPIKLTDKTLNVANDYGLKVIAGFWIGPIGTFSCGVNGKQYTLNDYKTGIPFDLTDQRVRNDVKVRFETYVEKFKNRPEILFWAIGNENNLHLDPNNPNQVKAWFSLVNEMGEIVRRVEGDKAYHPVAVVNGDLGFIGEANVGANDETLINIDIWGMNVYQGSSFGDLFVQYRRKSTKPLWIAEYGVDAWTMTDPKNPDSGSEDEQGQADWDAGLWDEIAGNSHISIGGTVMEYADEWWKPYEWQCTNPNDCNTRQNHFGSGPQDDSCPLDGKPDFYPPAPDNYWNQEWWGLMRIKQDSGVKPDIVTPRKAYDELKKRFGDAINNKSLESYIVSPMVNSSLVSSTVTFSWSQGRGVDEYWLAIGTSKGMENIYSASLGKLLEATVQIPLTGQPLYLRLKSKINGEWENKDYVYNTVDKVPPTGSLIINNNQSVTNSPLVMLTLNAIDVGSGMGTGSQMRLSNYGGMWRPWEPYVTRKNWLLHFGDGAKIVLVQFKDAKGNISRIYGDWINLRSIVQRIDPPRVTVGSGEVATMTFNVPADTVANKLYMYCPAGLTVGYGASNNICNTWINPSLASSSVNLMRFKVNNATRSVLKAVPNFYIYKSSNSKYAVGVSGEISVNPK